MASNLKDFFNRELIEELARDFGRAHRPFDSGRFVAECVDGLDELELLGRGWHIAEALRRHLPDDFPRAARILLGAIEARGDDRAVGMASFRYLPHTCFVAKYGLPYFEEAMLLQYELTKVFTAESSIRAYLIQHPEATYARLRGWAADSNVHVRRLVSEGTRPRLPWAARLPAFQKDPAPVIELLELLKDDPELYVRRSVANSLNDIAKDHPRVAVAVCQRWLAEATPERRWIVKHALRSLIKQGDTGALALMGAGGKPKVSVGLARFSPASPRIGEQVRFSFDVASVAGRRQSLLVDYRVHFVKANGRAAAKVFKLKTVDLPARGTVTLGGLVALRQLTTRKHYPGEHQVEALINGRAFALGSFRLLSARAGQASPGAGA